MPDQYFFPPGQYPNPRTVLASLTTVRFVPFNPQRTMLVIQNKASGTLYLKFGPGGSAIDFDLTVTANTYFEAPSPKFAQREHSGAWDKFTAGDVATIDEEVG